MKRGLYMSLTLQLSEVMKKYADCPAITDQDGTRTLSYGELDALCARSASKLKALGIRTGERVAVNMGRRTEYIAAELATLRIGAVVIPLNPDYPKDRVDYIRQDADIRFIIDEDFFRELPEEKDFETIPWRDFPEDTQEFIFYTSGSAGKPKGIIYRDRAVVQGLLRNIEGGFREVKPYIYGAFATMTFVASLLDYYRNFFLGGHVHMLSDEVRSDMVKLEEYYERAGITVGYMPPRILKLYHNRDADLRLIFTASEKASGIYSPSYRILNELGMTETMGAYCAFLIDHEYENTPVGMPLGDVIIRLLDEDGNEVSPGEEGIIVPTGNFPYEYNNLPEETETIFHLENDGRVSIHTGDIGRLLPDGNLLYINRSDWMMKINGQRVEPGEIESVMKEIPGVDSAVAKAFEQENGSMLLCGFYTVSSPVEKEAIYESLNRTLPHYMIPSVLVQMESFPVNANGKLDRKAIRCPDFIQQRSSYEAPENPVERAVAKGMEKLFHLPKIGRNDNFLQLGGDSLNAHLLAEMCEVDGVTPQLIMMGKTPAKIAKLLIGRVLRPMISSQTGDQKRCPISLAQQYQYDVCAWRGKNMNQNDCVLYYELTQDVDIQMLKKAIEQTVQAFPIYRVRINIRERWMEVDPTFQIRELSFSEEEFRAFREARLREERSFTGDPKIDAPLFDAAVIHQGGRSFLFLNLSHIIYDASGIKLFYEHISAGMEGREGPEETYSLFDVACFEQSVRATPFYENAWKFYDTYYQGLDQAFDFFDEAASYDVRVSRPLLTESTKGSLDSFLKRAGISALTLFQGALELTVQKLTGRKDFAYKNLYDGRISAELENTQGVLAKSVFIRSSADPEKTVMEYLAGIQESYQQLVYYDLVDAPELIRRHPYIRSGISLNYRMAPYNLRVNGKQLKVNAEYLKECREAHKVFAIFDLSINNAWEGEDRLATIASSKVSSEFAEEFLETYDGMLKKLMTTERLEQILL